MSEFFKNKEETILHKATKTRILSRRYIGNENIHTDCRRDEIYYNRVSLENLQITEAEYTELNAKFSLLHT